MARIFLNTYTEVEYTIEGKTVIGRYICVQNSPKIKPCVVKVTKDFMEISKNYSITQNIIECSRIQYDSYGRILDVKFDDVEE